VYQDVLSEDTNITPSMSRRGNCWDNASMENLFGHLKEEYLRHDKNPIFVEAEQLIAEYIYFYNYERIQLKTKQTPYQTRCLFG
jgi:transposase InsO family protein